MSRKGYKPCVACAGFEKAHTVET